MVRRASLVLLLASVGCVHARVQPEPFSGEVGPLMLPHAPPLVRVGEPVGLQLASDAESLIDHDRRLVRRDCSGLVETVFADVGLQLPFAEDVSGNAVAREFVAFRRDHALHVDRPLPGDLAFFHDTWDRNRNGRLDDPFTHVALVAQVDVDGTVTLVHFGSHGVATFKMNLYQLHQAHDVIGRRINDRLRVQKRRDPPRTPYLASELFVAFGRAPDRRVSYARR